jgi:Rrf2 family protein
VSANSRMSVAVHVLAWLAYDRRGTDKEVGTSQRIATSVNTNPVVIRRALGELRAAGLVEASRGRGGGWALARPAETITLEDVYLAVGDGAVFALHPAPPDAACYVGYGIRSTLGAAYQEAEAAVKASLARISIADVLRDTLALFPSHANAPGPRPS